MTGKRTLAALLTTCLLALLAPAPYAATELVADRVIVKKSARKLLLMKDGAVMRSFDIALGRVPEGHKEREGDLRTPEGEYFLTNRLEDSDFFMAIQVSYPNRSDAAHARKLGVPPGGQIMIHGQPDKPKQSPSYYANVDWTDGCIAVSNAAMVDIWQLTRPYTPISILP